MARKLTEKQQKFLDVLFEEAMGNVVEAKKLAGYSSNQYTAEIVNSLKDCVRGSKVNIEPLCAEVTFSKLLPHTRF